MPFARVNGLRLHYQTSGQGAQLIIIHGFTGNSAGYYLTIVPLLARDFNVVTYDLRGHGKSDMPPRGYTSEHMAADLHALMDHVGFDRAHLMGHSFGGEVALQYAAAHPDRVRSLILADTRVRAFQPRRANHTPRWPEIQAKLGELGVSVPPEKVRLVQELFDDVAESLWPGVRDPTHNNLAPFAPFAAGIWRRGYIEHLVRLLCQTTAGQDLRSVAGITQEKISRIRTPVLAIYGDQSVFLPTLGHLRTMLPYCQAHIVRGFGHMLPVTAPRLFVQLLRTFLYNVDHGTARDEPV
jgi:pimeloyl-ACP methyl ester carboxylesterase